jgi:hypothetical protein
MAERMIKMDFVGILTSLLIIAGLVEAVAEIIKPPYLQLKNIVLAVQSKPLATECSKYEKRVITVVLSLTICIVGKYGINMAAWDEPLIVQYITAGVIASLGSNVLHLLLSIAISIKDAIEKVKQATPE